jgi:hypothetical protein
MGSVPEKAAIEPAIIELLRITRLVTMILSPINTLTNYRTIKIKLFGVSLLTQSIT